MSLGWQCESALLPSKAKPIHVDGKSVIDAKYYHRNYPLLRTVFLDDEAEGSDI
jgi:hypothetical protein